MAYVVFRPLAAPRRCPARRPGEAAAELVRAHGTDTLSFFKLRADKHYFFSADRTRVRRLPDRERRAAALRRPGRPRGGAARPARRRSRRSPQARGLKLGAVGASERSAPAVRGAGAADDLPRRRGDRRPATLLARGPADPQGAPVGQPAQKAGFTAELQPVCELDARRCARGRARARARPRGRAGARLLDGDGLAPRRARRRDAGRRSPATSDPAGRSAASCTSCPCYGRAAMSLSFMRRDPETPNGLTEFLVVKAIELLRERGVEELSLNFAAFARWMHSPERRSERALGKLISARQPVLPDREPVPLQRQVLPALGAALPRLPGPVRACRGPACRDVGRGPAVPKPRGPPRGGSPTSTRLVARAR